MPPEHLQNQAFFMCKKYNSVFNPKLSTHECKETRRSRSCMAISFSVFQRLSSLTMKAEQFHGASVHELEEDYTSKTCSKCSKCKVSDIGLGKIYSCVTCASVFDRDFIAAKTSCSYLFCSILDRNLHDCI